MISDKAIEVLKRLGFIFSNDFLYFWSRDDYIRNRHMYYTYIYDVTNLYTIRYFRHYYISHLYRIELKYVYSIRIYESGYRFNLYNPINYLELDLDKLEMVSINKSLWRKRV